ncbi:Nucleoporin nup35 [Perkinsus chesapeaki]|uniref:Nucleoporin nup35 n=1 Tax=Perkinsus chesapeaki TaxID=330153 RepID=A0A7J6MDN4_PERCH|nr:Nucleoporin nup35 [Perkinsus chesapeaki]
MFRPPPSNDTPPRGGLFGSSGYADDDRHLRKHTEQQSTYGLKQQRQQAELFGDTGAPTSRGYMGGGDPLEYAGGREDLPPPGCDDIPTMFSSFPTKSTSRSGGLLDTSGVLQNRAGAYTAEDSGFGPVAGGSFGGLASMGSGRSSGCWVTVFGFAPAMAVAVRHHIEAVLGEKIAECRVGNGNFMHVCLPSPAAARNCLQLSGSVLFEGTMIGIVPCTSPSERMIWLVDGQLINSGADEDTNDVGYTLPASGTQQDGDTSNKSRLTASLAPQAIVVKACEIVQVQAVVVKACEIVQVQAVVVKACEIVQVQAVVVKACEIVQVQAVVVLSRRTASCLAVSSPHMLRCFDNV